MGKMNTHGISSPNTMISKGGPDDSPLSSRSGMNDQFEAADKNTFVKERVEEHHSEPWQDNRSKLRKLQDWWLLEVLGCLLSIGTSCGMLNKSSSTCRL